MTGASDELRFASVPMDRAPGRDLVAAMRAEMAELYSGLDLDGADMPKAGPKELGPPSGDFLVGTLAGAPVCCGGIKRLDARTCEIKRMYVVPDSRGQGVARALLRALEDRARALGYAVARLDTGARQAAAQHIYASEGYRAIENFNANPAAAYWGEKPL